MRHQNRVAIATGATQNIGLASARRLANERAAVPMVDRQDEKGELEAQRLQADGGQAAYLHADLTDPESPAAVVDAGLARFGQLDILVNNAAPKRGLVRISQVEAEDWQEQFKVMMMATQLLMRHATAALERNGDGAIVNVASAHGSLTETDRTIYDTRRSRLPGLPRSTWVCVGYGSMRSVRG